MPYIISVFGATYAGGVVLPIKGMQQPVGLGAVPSTLVQTPGGNSWDSNGSAQTRLHSQVITISGGYVAASAAALTTYIDSMRALVGTRSYLWSTPDGGTTKRFRMARCLDVRATAKPGFTRWIQVDMDFELAASPWSGAAHAEVTALDTSPHVITTTNGGNVRVRDAILQLETTTVNTITLVGVSISGKSDWHWTGSLVAGVSVYLIINSGTKRVTNMGADAYAGFALQAGQADVDWLPLEPGVNTISVHFTGSASASALLTYWDGWA